MAARIPNYALYGDQDAPAWSNSFNFEWIPQRSAPYQWEIQVHRHDAFVQLLCLTAGSGEVHMNGARIAARAPCLIVVPAGAAHGFHFSPDVDGPVVTATQKVLESLAALLMPGLVGAIRAPRVLALPDTGALEALMPLFLAIERESRSHSEGQTAAGMAVQRAQRIRAQGCDAALQRFGQWRGRIALAQARIGADLHVQLDVGGALAVDGADVLELYALRIAIDHEHADAGPVVLPAGDARGDEQRIGPRRAQHEALLSRQPPAAA